MHDSWEAMSVYGGGDCRIIASFVDVHNAFNQMSRQNMLDEAAKHAPSLAWFMNALYGRS